MATALIGALRVVLGMDSAAFERGATAAERRATALKKNLNSTFSGIASTFKSFGAGFVGGIFGGLSVSAIANGIQEVVHSVAELADQAKKAGVSAEALQAYGFVASQAGLSVAELADSFVQLNKRVGDAVLNGGELKDVFTANNLTFSDDAIENLLKVSGLIKNARNEIDKATIANLAFGRSGAELIQFLEQGPDVIRQMVNESYRTGHVIHDELTQRAKQFDDAWSAAWDKFSKTAKSNILDVAKDLANLGQATEDALAGTSSDQVASRLASARTELASLKQQLDDGVSGRVKFAIEQKVAQLESVIAVLERANSAVDVNRAGKGDLLPSPNSGGVPTNPTILPVKPDPAPRAQQFDAQVDAYKAVRSEAQSYIDSLEDESKALENEIATLGMSSGEKAKYLAIAEQTTGATDAEKTAIAAKAEQIGVLTEKLEELRAVQELATEVGNSLKDAFTGFFDTIAEGTKPVKAFKDSILQLGRSLVSTFANSAASSLSTIVGGDFLKNLFAGFFAEGGTIPAGQWGIVGENGPEPVYAGRSSATVVPNGSGNSNVSVYMNINNPIDPAGFQRSRAQMARDISGAISLAQRIS